MEFERWIRYLVPGYVALAPLIFAVAFLPNKLKAFQTPLLAALGVLGPGIGFLVHQLHMCFHECFYLKNSKRPIIVCIMNWCGKAKPRNNEATLKVTKSEALLAWNYFYYDSKFFSKKLHHYMLRCWYFIHSFCSTGWAFFVGYAFLILLIVGPFHLETNADIILITIWPYFVSVYIVGCLFFFLKSWSTQKTLEQLEALVAHIHSEEIEKIITSILQLRVEKPFPPSEMTTMGNAQPDGSVDQGHSEPTESR